MKKFSIALAALATIAFAGAANAQDRMMDRGGMGMHRDGGMHRGMMHREMHRGRMMMHRHHRHHMMRKMMREM